MGNYCCFLKAPQVNNQISINLTKPYGSDDNRKPAASPPRKSGSGDGGEDTGPPVLAESPVPVGRVVTSNLRMYTLGELKRATMNFRPGTVLGEGGFGRVFKGWVDEKTLAPAMVGVGIPVAVKMSKPDSEQGLQEWQSEVKFLGKFSHRNLVKLIGYCWEDRQFLLVYEYIERGSLEHHLFKKGPEPLSWDARIKIAIGAARGLDFLHTSKKSVIFRDFKPSNILLDGDYNAKLSDFGLAKLGPANGNSHVTTQVMGTPGYAAPEYIATGHLYVKSDVYGFGVVLLEMLTGRRAMDLGLLSVDQNLVKWAKPSLTDEKRLVKIMDPRFKGRYPIKGAARVAELVLKCLNGDPKNRPSMDEVLAELEAVSSISEMPRVSKLSLAVWLPSFASASSQQQQQNHTSLLTTTTTTTTTVVEVVVDATAHQI